MNRHNLLKAVLLGATAISLSSLVACATAQKAGETAADAATEAATDEAETMATDVAAEAESQAAAEVAAMAPDQEKFAKHAAEHITYKADKAAVLQACAETEEFSAAEKLWVSEKLPEGEYASTEELMKALGFEAAAEAPADAPAEG